MKGGASPFWTELRVLRGLRHAEESPEGESCGEQLSKGTTCFLLSLLISLPLGGIPAATPLLWYPGDPNSPLSFQLQNLLEYLRSELAFSKELLINSRENQKKLKTKK